MFSRVFIRTFLSLAGLFLFALLLAAPVYGQGERATVTGVVTDSSASLIVGAQVSIRNVDTNITTTTTSNAAGIYYLPALPPGPYELRVEQAGFRPSVVTAIRLGAGLTATVNVTLEVGAVTESVQVTATAVQLEAQSTGLGKILAQQTIAELPTLARDALDLASLTPGVAPTGGGTSGNATSAQMSGGLARENAVLTDGGESRAAINSKSAFTVPMESVAEFRVDTATYAAEFGRSGGGVVNIVTKTGTNVFHGAGYEFYRSDKLNANSWTNNRNNVAKSVTHTNQFGGALGGPIVRDRTFFYTNVEFLRTGSPRTILATVPTAAQKAGNFMGTLDTKGNQITIYDPTTTRPDPATPGNYVRTPFPGNQITNINPVSANMLKYWPADNRTGEGPTKFNNFYKSLGQSVSPNNIWVGRIDHNLSDKHRLYGRFNGTQSSSQTTGLTPDLVAFTSNSIGSNAARSALVSFVSTFTPSLLGEARVSMTRTSSTSRWVEDQLDLTTLGFPKYLNDTTQYRTFPTVQINQYNVGNVGYQVTYSGTTETTGLNGGSYSHSAQSTYQAQYHLTAMKVRHKIKGGVETELIRDDSFQSSGPGQYLFDRGYTQGPNPVVSSPSAGHGFATFLLGEPMSGYLAFSPAITLYKKYIGLYVQDDWQITPNLTANLGFRYEYTQPWAEKWGRTGYFDFNGTEPVTGAKGTFHILAPGQFQVDPVKDKVGPRVGLAYKLGSKTVIRAGVGIFYAATDTLNVGVSDQGNGLYARTEMSMGPPNSAPNSPPAGGSWSNPFANGINAPTRSDTFAGQNIRTFDRNHPMPKLTNWSFNIQRMVTPTVLVEAGYVGNRIQHINQNMMYNQDDPLLLSLGSKLRSTVPNPFYGKIPQGPLGYSTVELRQLLRPYPQYMQMLIVRVGYGDAHYHGFQLRVEKQLSHGLAVTLGYTVAKRIVNAFESDATETGPQDARYNPNYSRTLDTNDIPQRAVTSVMYAIPFGRGKQFLSSGLLGGIIGNWNVGGIVVLQSGIPLRIGAPDNTGLLDFALNTGRGDRLHNPVLPKDQRTTQRYFDTTAFAPSALYTMPNDSLTQPSLRDYGRKNLDLSVIRTQRLSERYSFQIRGDFINFFNTPALTLGNGSSVTVGTAQFGQVLTGGSPRNIMLSARFMF